MLMRLVFVSGVLVLMLLWTTCVGVFVRVNVLKRMTMFDVSMLMLMVMLVGVFVFVLHELPSFPKHTPKRHPPPGERSWCLRGKRPISSPTRQ
jgi:hypothetical protein